MSSYTARREWAEGARHEQLQSLFQTMRVGVVLLGPQAEVKLCNQAALELLGLTEDQLAGKTWFDPEGNAIREDGSPYPGEEHPIPRAIASRQPVRNVTLGVYRPKTQDRLWLLVNAEPRLAPNGSVSEVVCSFTDITERKRDLGLLTEWKNRYEAAIRASGQILYDWNAVTNDITWGGDYEKILGYSAQEMRGDLTHWMALVHPDDLPAFLDEIDRVVETRRPFCLQYRVRTKDGRYLVAKNQGYFYQDDAGQIIRMLGFVSDITEQTRAEEELRASEERFRKVFANAATGMTLENLEGRFLEANRAFCEITGYKEEELLELNFRDITHPEDLSGDLSLDRDLVAGKITSCVIEKRYVHKEGRVVWVRNSFSLLGANSREPMRVITLIEDITARKHAEEELRASEERFREVFAHAATGVTLQDLQGRFLEVNRAFCEITGYTERELIGSNYRSITHPEDVVVNTPRMEELLADGIPSLVVNKRYVCKKGRVIWVRNSISLIRDSHHVPIRVITLVEDVTDRKQAEEALRQLSGQLLRAQDEERRRLARELHDSTAQSIAALGMNLGMVSEFADGLDSQARDALRESVTLADQCIRELRTFSYLLHPPILDQRGLVSALPVYVEGFAERSGIAVKLDLAPDLGRLPPEVELVLFRIVQESLTNIHRHSGSRTAAIRITRSDQKVLMQVRDQGHGAADGMHLGDVTRGRIGVGIAGMRERVRQIGGRFEIRSRPGGTDVEVTVPVSGGAC